MKRLPLSLWIVVEIIIIVAAVNGNKNAGYVALINLGLLVFSIAKYYYEEVYDGYSGQKSYNSQNSSAKDEEDLDQANRILLRDLQADTYSDTKISALESLFKICYSPNWRLYEPYDKSFSKIQDEYGNHYSFETVKKMVAFQFEKAYNALNQGYDMSDKSKERLRKIKRCMDGEDFNDVYKK